MNDINFKDRPYDLFVSYAHRNYEQVAPIARWLRDVAKVKLWWDEKSLAAGSTLETALPLGLQASRGVLFVVSKESAGSGWVQGEFGMALRQRTQFREFRILCLSIDGSEPPPMVQTTKWVPLPGGVFTPDSASQILGGLYGAGDGLTTGRDVYVSRSWRSSETAAADEICRKAIRAGWRLIGDSGDQPQFDEATRIRSLVGSCGALLAIAPNRNGSGRTSKFIEREIEVALELGVPVMALLEPGVSLSAPLAERLAPEYLFDASKEEHVATALETLKEEFITPPRPHYVFLATSLRSGLTTSSSARQIISQITGVDCVLGADLGGKGAQQKIIELIRRALFVMADVSDGNLNTLIEAGVALGAGTPLFLLAAGEPRPTRFMFRDFEVNFYRDELELYGALHREARKYRRNVLNRDLAGDNWF